MPRIAGSAKWAWGVLGLGLASCVQPAPQAFCDAGHACATGLLCDVSKGLCFAPSKPTVEISSPASTEVLTGESVQIRGKVQSDSGGATVEVKLGAAEAADGWQAATTDQDGSFESTLSLPMVDGQAVRFSARATALGLQNSAWALVNVDNVGPTSTFAPAGSERFEPVAGVAFSEPIAASSTAPLVLQPSSGTGRWNEKRTFFDFPSLQPDTRYQLTGGAVKDAVGNQGAAIGSQSFITGPVLPGSGTRLVFDDTPIKDFQAASDEDGVISVYALLDTTPLYLAGGTFNPKTGRFELLTLESALGLALVQHVGSASVASPNANTKRTSVFYDERQANGVSRAGSWRIDTGAVQRAPANVLAIVPEPGGCGEDAPDTVGFALSTGSGAAYHRPGLPDVALGGPTFNPRDVATRSPNHWEWFDSATGALMRQTHTCACDGTGCAFSTPEQVRNDLKPTYSGLSVAMTRSTQRLYVFDDNSGSRVEACYDCMNGGAGACTHKGADSKSAPGDSLVVVAEHSGSKVLGARHSGSAVQLIERDLAGDCSGQWSVLASVPDGAIRIAKFHPVMAGDKPGLLYLADDAAIHLLVP